MQRFIKDLVFMDRITSGVFTYVYKGSIMSTSRGIGERPKGVDWANK